MRPNSFGPLPPRTKMPNLLTLFPGGRNSVWFGQEIMPKNKWINVLAGSQVGSELCCRFEKLVRSEDDTGLKTTIPRVSCSLCQPGGHVIQAHVFPKSARKRRLRGLRKEVRAVPGGAIGFWVLGVPHVCRDQVPAGLQSHPLWCPLLHWPSHALDLRLSTQS